MSVIIPVQAHATNEGSQLAAGWSEARDDEGRRYYFNSATGETSWDAPSAELAFLEQANSGAAPAPVPSPVAATPTFAQPVHMPTWEPPTDLCGSYAGCRNQAIVTGIASAVLLIAWFVVGNIAQRNDDQDGASGWASFICFMIGGPFGIWACIACGCMCWRKSHEDTMLHMISANNVVHVAPRQQMPVMGTVVPSNVMPSGPWAVGQAAGTTNVSNGSKAT